MGLSLPVHGFVGLLTRREQFMYHFNRIALKSLVGLGLFPEVDNGRLAATFELWREEVAQWFAALRASEYDEVSHIKMAGTLMWSFIQGHCCPVDDVVEIKDRHFGRMRALGFDANLRRIDDYRTGAGVTFRASPNPALGFVFTSAVFNSIQRGRGMKRDCIDLSAPPMTSHYFHNLCCWYLVERSPSKEDLYMLYKTMDLYGLNLPRDEGRPRRSQA